MQNLGLPKNAATAAIRRTPWLTGVAAVLMAGAAAAADPAGAPTVLPPITVEGQAKDTVGAGGIVIDAETIERRNPTDIRDVFSGEPGVAVGAPTPIAQKLYVQGMEDTNLNVQIDGTRQVNATWHHIGTAIIDPGMLKSVKIETGVAPADAGPHGLGGSIAYQTKDARDVVKPGNIFGGFGKLGYDTNTHGFSEAMTLAAQYDGYEALGYVSNVGGRNYTDGMGTKVAGTKPEMQNALAKAAVTGRDGHRLSFSGSYLEDIGVRPARPNFASLTNAVGRGLNDIEYTRSALTAAYKTDKPSAAFDPEIGLNFSKTQLTAYNVSAGGVVSDLGSDIDTLNGKAQNTFAFGLGKITAGVDFYHDKATGTYERKPAATRTPGRFTETATNVGGYAQARLTPTEKLRTSFGMRVDNQWFEGIEGSDFRNLGLSGNANVEYDFQKNLTGYAGAGRTFGGIPIGETAIYNFSGVWNYAGLEPSHSRNYKGGLKGTLGGFSADANIFYNKIENDHDLSAVTRNTTYDLVTRGGGISGAYNYGDGFVRATYTHTIVRTDGAIPGSTSASFFGVLMGDMFTLEAAHSFKPYGVRVGTSNQFTLKNDENSFANLPGYAVFNLFGEWTPPQFQNLVLRVDAKNLLDQAYADRATTGYDSSMTNRYYQPGRTFLLTAKATF